MIIASIPDIASLPKMVLAAAVFSVSDNPPRLERKLSSTPFSVFIFPLLSVRLIPYFFIAVAILSVGAAIFASAVFNDVPAIEPLTLAFAINPKARDVSSTLYFIAPAIGATYLKDSPIMETLVFALAADCAKTSEKCAASPAFKPNAVSASVTISLVVPKSSPDAAARFKIPSIPSSICCESHPAIAI